MSKPYDATTKELIETDPHGWVTYFGGTARPSAVGMIDADLSTVTTDTDKVIRVDEPHRWLLHLDIQSSADESIERRLLRYNALLHARHGVPVASAVVLLRQKSNMKWLNGCLSMAPPVGPAWDFRYQVIRVWERPASEFLNGPLGLLPLAPLANVSEPNLPEVVEEMRTKIDAQKNSLAAKLWSATYILMGLTYTEELTEALLSGVRQMEDSATYQAIKRRALQEGRQEGAAEEVRKLLLRQGRKKFGTPSAAHEQAVGALTDLARLEALFDKLNDVNAWDELFAE